MQGKCKKSFFSCIIKKKAVPLRTQMISLTEDTISNIHF